MVSIKKRDRDTILSELCERSDRGERFGSFELAKILSELAGGYSIYPCIPDAGSSLPLLPEDQFREFLELTTAREIEIREFLKKKPIKLSGVTIVTAFPSEARNGKARTRIFELGPKASERWRALGGPSNVSLGELGASLIQ